jgi:cyclic beta-1,2-glucan synthetase
VSDIEVVEEFPSRYDVAAARQHRWARGDWQLLPWILGRGHAVTGVSAGRISLIGRWKMLDNLRRTLSAPAAFVSLMLAWMLPNPAALLWSGFVVATIGLPAFLPMLAAIVPRRAGISLRSHWYALRGDIASGLGQIVFLIAFLAYQAWLMSDAVLRTLFRLFVTRRNLLQWITAAQTSQGLRLNLTAAYRRMSGGVLLACVPPALIACSGFGIGWRIGGYNVLGKAWGNAWPAAPFIALWLAAPALAVWISRSPRVAGRVRVSPADARALRLVARRTWRYFETFVTPRDNMLPPDNFQEDPKAVVAHRTSPTNIGLYLLSVVSAHDFGWSGTLESVERLEATLATMRRLERHRGHFLNWYDTQDLRPLDPRYVSSVDSGNLAAHLLAAANACQGWTALPAPLSIALTGIDDAVALAREAIANLPAERRTQAVPRQELHAAVEAFAAELRIGDPARLTSTAGVMVDLARTFAVELGDEASADLAFWTGAAQRSLESWQRDPDESAAERLILCRRLATLESAFRSMAMEMDFAFLVDPERRLLSIGFRPEDGSLDANCYDLLASEARLASFIAIAKNDVPAKHWFRLGRAITLIGRGHFLVRLDVRVSDAVARPEGAGREPPRSNQPAHRRAADRLRAAARHSVGHFGVRL